MTDATIITTSVKAAWQRGDWVECWMGGPVWERCLWLGTTGRNEEGRFVRRGDPSETFALDIGQVYMLTYTRLDIDRGWLRIRASAARGYTFDPGAEPIALT